MKNAYMRNGIWYSQFLSTITNKRVQQKLSKNKVEAKKLLVNLIAEHAGVQNTSVKNNTKTTSGVGWQFAIDKWESIQLDKYGSIQRNHMLSVLEKLTVFTDANYVSDVKYGDVEYFLKTFVSTKK